MYLNNRNEKLEEKKMKLTRILTFGTVLCIVSNPASSKTLQFTDCIDTVFSSAVYEIDGSRERAERAARARAKKEWSNAALEATGSRRYSSWIVAKNKQIQCHTQQASLRSPIPGGPRVPVEHLWSVTCKVKATACTIRREISPNSVPKFSRHLLR